MNDKRSPPRYESDRKEVVDALAPSMSASIKTDHGDVMLMTSDDNAVVYFSKPMRKKDD